MVAVTGDHADGSDVVPTILKHEECAAQSEDQDSKYGIHAWVIHRTAGERNGEMAESGNKHGDGGGTAFPRDDGPDSHNGGHTGEGRQRRIHNPGEGYVIRGKGDEVGDGQPGAVEDSRVRRIFFFSGTTANEERDSYAIAEEHAECGTVFLGSERKADEDRNRNRKHAEAGNDVGTNQRFPIHAFEFGEPGRFLFRGTWRRLRKR